MSPLQKRYVLSGVLTVAGVTLVALLAWWLLPSPADPVPDAGHAHAAAADDDFFGNLFKVYTPRRVCMFYEEPLIWLHLLSDLFIGIAYYSIPFALIYFVRRRKDLQFSGIVWMFALFILSCGTTHFIGVWDLWQPLYRLDGLVKAATATVSIATAIVLWPLIPRALALPSPAQLERRVEERTRELAGANEALRHEIAARRQAEAEREQLLHSEREARAEAEQANRLKDEFLATLSHELRTPLHAILGWAQLLRRPELEDSRRADGMAVIERSARSQARLIDDLLDTSRIVAGKLRLETRVLDLAEVVDGAVAAVQHAADGRRIAIERHEQPGCCVDGDAQRLQQVVWNLLSNAVKFTPPGGRIRIETSSGGGEVRLVVTDTGEGISADFLPLVFERFRQADGSTTRRHGGLGLGLGIVRHLVELHGGRVEAHSDGAGRGARFVVTLPEADSSAIPRTRPASPARPLPAGTRVLLVDDDPDAREVVRTMLEVRGGEVTTAGSAEQGLALLRRQAPAVLVADLGMPDVDGFELISRIRALQDPVAAALPAVALSALASDGARAEDAGFDAFLAKPVDAEELTRLLHRLLERRPR